MFVQQQQLSTSIFYVVKKKFGLTYGSFVSAQIIQQVKFIEAPGLITLTIDKTNVSLPSSTSVNYLSQLLRSLVL